MYTGDNLMSEYYREKGVVSRFIPLTLLCFSFFPFYKVFVAN